MHISFTSSPSGMPHTVHTPGKDRYRDNKSPVEILRERFRKIDEGVLKLPPVILELPLGFGYKEGNKRYRTDAHPSEGIGCIYICPYKIQKLIDKSLIFLTFKHN